MKKCILMTVAVCTILGCMSTFVFAEEEGDSSRIFVMREAQQRRDNSCAIVAYLQGDMLDVVVEARMYASKPHIMDVRLKGEKLKPVSFVTKKTILATAEEAQAYEVTNRDGIFRFRDEKKTMKLEGRLTRELFKIRVPIEQIEPGRDYMIWVNVEAMSGGEKSQRFRFPIEDFAEKVHKALQAQQEQE